jgi:[methyl-Co(III) methanol-specific corrinoid protein]:coenzyme M methyltransferase
MATEERKDNGMTPRERLLRSLACKEVDRPAVAGMTTAATTELMDYCGAAWPDVHTDAKLMTKLGLSMYPFVGLESCRIPYCLSYEAEALGCKVDLGKKNSTPMVKSNPLLSRIDEDLVLPSRDEIKTMARNKVILDAARAMKEGAGNELPTIVGVTGPFTIAGHLVGTDNLLLWIVTEPEKTHKIVKFAAEYERMWLQEVEKLHVDLIQMSEPSASWDMINPDWFDEYAGPYVRRAFSGLEDTKKVLHICGNMVPMLEQMVSTGADGLSIEEKSDPYKAVEIVDGRAALIGNVGVVKPLLQGTPEQVKHDALRSVDAGFNIISAGCGLSALIKKENLQAMVDAVKGLPAKRR